ncbi:uncharacterized protein BXZ73DRAFT_53065 [Epithele typhae]|uniref:uncharacterized protein n=1 Tax=Epithele typhae TaxID=378194 RepID=UPI002008D719|nr:uncharacterized protein BXZ73DRAFT_53065 [Epithele typhae]KAH9918221.1 hypothetical protein BXZ73DRAFT_53065 [Epithele typhae]
MPVTFKVARHHANPVRPCTGLTGADSFILKACPTEWPECGKTLQSSLSSESLRDLIPRRNGFVSTVVEAYGQHHHLVLRPDDVWIAVLVQLGFYVNAHAEELRQYFVAHQGKKELFVDLEQVGMDFGAMAVKFSELLDENVVDKTFVEWTRPDFTTSTAQDRIICSVLLVSTLAKYFEFGAGETCGLPSVTLLGERRDWASLLARLDRLPELGDEPARWAELLRPVLRKFVKAFDGEVDRAFWSHIILHDDRTCGIDKISGWITAFCVWNAEGKWLSRTAAAAPPSTAGSVIVRARGNVMHARRGVYVLDGVEYPNMLFNYIPVGYSTVDVNIGGHPPCKMLAGHLASAVYSTDGPREGDEGDTLSPAPQWILYEVPEERYLKQRRKEAAERLVIWDMWKSYD